MVRPNRIIVQFPGGTSQSNRPSFSFNSTIVFVPMHWVPDSTAGSALRNGLTLSFREDVYGARKYRAFSFTSGIR